MSAQELTGGLPSRARIYLKTPQKAIVEPVFWTMLSAAASLSLQAHPHMLRHCCGFALADQGADTRLIQDYLGHRNIQQTVKYTASNPARFQRLWQ